MPYSKQRPTTAEAETHDLIETLREAVSNLRDEVKVLRTVLDEIRDEVGWVLNNPEKFRCQHPDERPIMHITSMPKDVLAPDFGERLNRFTANDLPREELPEQVPPVVTTTQQGNLFE